MNIQEVVSVAFLQKPFILCFIYACIYFITTWVLVLQFPIFVSYDNILLDPQYKLSLSTSLQTIRTSLRESFIIKTTLFGGETESDCSWNIGPNPL